MGLADLIEKVRAGILQEVEDMFEAGLTAVVRIGYLGFAEYLGITQHRFDRCCGLWTCFVGKTANRRQIGVIHGQYEVKSPHIIQADLTRSAGELDASLVGRGLHSPVCWVAGMPAPGPS